MLPIPWCDEIALKMACYILKSGWISINEKSSHVAVAISMLPYLLLEEL
jgi:hypothetical protein